MVELASRGAIEFGCDGLIIEIATRSARDSKPKCDADQAIDAATLRRITIFAHERARAVGQEMKVAG